MKSGLLNSYTDGTGLSSTAHYNSPCQNSNKKIAPLSGLDNMIDGFALPDFRGKNDPAQAAVRDAMINNSSSNSGANPLTTFNGIEAMYPGYLPLAHKSEMNVQPTNSDGMSPAARLHRLSPCGKTPCQ